MKEGAGKLSAGCFGICLGGARFSLLTIVLVLASLAFGEQAHALGRAKIPKSKSELKDAEFQPPRRPSCVRKVSRTIVVEGTFDGNGCLYTWVGKGYPRYCGSFKEISENQPPMFLLRPGARLRNLHMECALDGIHTTSNNVIERVVNRDVEEDAITIGRNITIRNSKFYFCQDKALQMNSASNVLIEGNEFYHCESPIKANYGRNVIARNNKFRHVGKAIRAASRGSNRSDIRASRNDFYRVECAFQALKGSRVTDAGGNRFDKVQKKRCGP